MSLLRQLWLSVSAAMLLILLGTLFVSVYTARGYLEQQLLTQSNDGASALALSITQQGTDPGTVETLVNATFDSGHYMIVRYTLASGEVGVERAALPPAGKVPGWFMQIFPLHAEPGRALVSQGWHQAGEVFIQSHTQFAHEALWRGSVVMFGVLAGAGVLWAIGITALMRRIRRPLDDMAEQARKIGEGQFLKVPQTNIVELKDIGCALNRMSDRVQAMFAEQANRIAELQSEASRDGVTGLTNRTMFMGELRNALSEESAPSGVLTLLRIRNLQTLNKALGREKTDAFLRSVAQQLEEIFSAMPEAIIARLNGADFAILTPDGQDQMVSQLAQEWRVRLASLATDLPEGGEALADIAIAQYQRPDVSGDLLARVDSALMEAESSGAGICVAKREGTGDLASKGEGAWGSILKDALASDAFCLQFYPVLDSTGQVYHQEGMLRLNQAGEPTPVSAGRFMPAAVRLGLAGECDLKAVELALLQIQKTKLPVAVNLAPQTLLVAGIERRLDALLHRHPVAARQLSIEVSERGLDDDATALVRLGAILQGVGVGLGIEHFGRKLSVLPQLYTLNVRYLKLDGSLIHCIQDNPGNQRLVKAIVDMSSGLGVTTIAEQVHTESEWASLKSLGVNGLTGPAVAAVSIR